MKNSVSAIDPIKAHMRKSVAKRRLGENAQCTTCGEKQPEALDKRTNPLICGSCRRKKKEQSTLDNHHINGQANSPITISIPVNDHRAQLSTAQMKWPRETLRNPDGCPLRRAAAFIRGFIDTVTYYMQTFLLWIAELLEWLSGHLRELWGRFWWRETPLNQFSTNGGNE